MSNHIDMIIDKLRVNINSLIRGRHLSYLRGWIEQVIDDFEDTLRELTVHRDDYNRLLDEEPTYTVDGEGDGHLQINTWRAVEHTGELYVSVKFGYLDIATHKIYVGRSVLMNPLENDEEYVE